MINASDLLDQTKSNFNFKELKKFYLLIRKKIHFIRVACHHDEVFKLKLFFQYLKKFKIKIFINIMQICEIKREINTNLQIFKKTKILASFI